MPDGTLESELGVPASFVSSVCFGDGDQRDLYITTADGKLLRGRSEVAGLALTPGRV